MNALDRWAREYGYSDFDTFLRTGGGIADAFRDIQKRIRALQDALTELGPSLQWVRHEQPEITTVTSNAVPDDQPATTDNGERSENAHVQGAELG